MSQLILFNKPYGVICQFSEHEKHPCLAQYISKGLLLLTDDGKLQHKIADPKHKMKKTYWVQVDNAITQRAVDQLKKGVNPTCTSAYYF